MSIKKHLIIGLLLFMVFCITGCGAQENNNMLFVAENDDWICSVELQQDDKEQYKVQYGLVYIGEKTYENVYLDLQILKENTVYTTRMTQPNWSSEEKECFANTSSIYPEDTFLKDIIPKECVITLDEDEEIRLTFNQE